jgi:hypothetical protein
MSQWKTSSKLDRNNKRFEGTVSNQTLLACEVHRTNFFLIIAFYSKKSCKYYITAQSTEINTWQESNVSTSLSYITKHYWQNIWPLPHHICQTGQQRTDSPDESILLNNRNPPSVCTVSSQQINRSLWTAFNSRNINLQIHLFDRNSMKNLYNYIFL